jgi:hypothetical protein
MLWGLNFNFKYSDPGRPLTISNSALSWNVIFNFDHQDPEQPFKRYHSAHPTHFNITSINVLNSKTHNFPLRTNYKIFKNTKKQQKFRTNNKIFHISHSLKAREQTKILCFCRRNVHETKVWHSDSLRSTRRPFEKLKNWEKWGR